MTVTGTERSGEYVFRLGKVVGMVAAFALVTVACGSDDDGGAAESTDVSTDTAGSDVGSDTTEAVTEDTEVAEEPDSTEAVSEDTEVAEEPDSTEAVSEDTEVAEEPTGDPVKVVIIGSAVNVQDSADGLEAAVSAINAQGGIQGRPVEFSVCADGEDANASAQCARDAVSDEAVIAMVGNSTSFGGDVNPVLEEANMASVAASLFTAGDFASPIVFPVQGGSLVSIVGQATLCTDVLESQQLGLPYLDVPTGAALPPLIQQVVTAPRGLPDPIVVPVPVTAADVASQVATLSDADCAAVALTTDLASRTINTARQQGLDIPFAVPGGVYNESTITDQLGADVTDVYPLGQTNNFSDGYLQMEDEVAEYLPEATERVNNQTAQAWLGMHMLADVANGLDGEVTRESIVDALRKLTGYETNGMTTCPLDFTQEATALGGSIPNLYPCVTGAWAYEFVDGELQPLNDGQDLQVFGS